MLAIIALIKAIIVDILKNYVCHPGWFVFFVFCPILFLFIFGFLVYLGYVLLLVLIILLLAFFGLMKLASHLSKIKPLYGSFFIGIAVVLIPGKQLYAFYAVNAWELDYISPSPGVVALHDTYMEEVTDLIRENALDSGVALWINSPQVLLFHGLRHFQYYLPEVDVYRSIPAAFEKKSEQAWWHVRGPNFDRFENEAVISSDVTKLFTITWPPNPRLDGTFQIPIRMSTGELITFYDLTDEAAKELLNRKYGFIFIENI